MTAAEEKAYGRGTRDAWLRLLAQASRELGHEDPLAAAAELILHLHQTRAALRLLCAAHGVPEWEDDAHLADVVIKLGQHLGKS